MNAIFVLLILVFLLFSVLGYMLHRIKGIDEKIDSIYKSEYERKNNYSQTEENL